MVSMWYCVSLHRCIYIYLHVYCLYSSRKCLFIYMYLCLINLPVVNYLSNKLVTIHITRLTVWRSFLCADACRVCISSTLTVSTSGYHRTKSVPFAASISRRLRKVTCRWSSAAAPLWQNGDHPSCEWCLFHGDNSICAMSMIATCTSMLFSRKSTSTIVLQLHVWT